MFYFEADPHLGSAFYFEADLNPDPTFYFDDPETTFYLDTDPDPPWNCTKLRIDVF